MSPARPWCCPEPRCMPLHQLKGDDKPLSEPDPGETFLCFGKAPEVTFIYDGVEHVNDVRSCTYTALKGVISFQENYGDWIAIHDAYRLALRALERHNAAVPPTLVVSASSTRDVRRATMSETWPEPTLRAPLPSDYDEPDPYVDTDADPGRPASEASA